MKKALIIAYDFPPYNSVGAQRPYNFYRFFNRCNIYPVVITRHWDENITDVSGYLKPSINRANSNEETEIGEIIRVPYSSNFRDKLFIKYNGKRFSFFRKILSFFHIIFQFVFSFTDNKRGIYKEADKQMALTQFDVIIASGEPFILFKYAHKLSAKYNVPWVADYRDGWSNNIHMPYFNIIYQWVCKYYFSIIEKFYLHNVSLITTVNYLNKKELKAKFPNKFIEVIFNGYDLEALEKSQKLKQTSEVFTIVYSGTIYPYQPLNLFFKVFEKFINENPGINVKFYLLGTNFNAESIKKHLKDELQEHVEIINRMKIDELYRQIRKANLCLVLAHEKVRALPAKVFDYLALDRKIIQVIGDHGPLQQLIEETESGVICKTEIDVLNVLTDSYKEFVKTGKVTVTGKNIRFYSRFNQTLLFCEHIYKNVFHEICQKK